MNDSVCTNKSKCQASSSEDPEEENVTDQLLSAFAPASDATSMYTNILNIMHAAQVSFDLK